MTIVRMETPAQQVGRWFRALDFLLSHDLCQQNAALEAAMCQAFFVQLRYRPPVEDATAITGQRGEA
jgi:hypothetical protein